MGHALGMTIRAWRVHQYGEPRDALQIDDVEEPTPGVGQMVVRTSMTPLNFNEVDGCFGRYRTVDPALPFTLGMETVGSGETLEGATRFAKGAGRHGAF